MPKKEDLQNDLRRRVLWSYYQDPTIDQKAVADNLEITIDQVKHAVETLRNDGYLSRKVAVDFEYLGYPMRYRVDIFVSPDKLREGKGGWPEDEGVDSQKNLARYILNRLPRKEMFKGKILVEDVLILLGNPSDLSAVVRAKDTDAMLEFITEGLRMCRAIYQTSSSIEAWSCREG